MCGGGGGSTEALARWHVPSYSEAWCVCIRGCAYAFRRGRMHVQMLPASHVFFSLNKVQTICFFMENNKQVLLHFLISSQTINKRLSLISDDLNLFYVIQCRPSNSIQVPLIFPGNCMIVWSGTGFDLKKKRCELLGYWFN
jgi:hypothetical protein